MTHHLKSIDVFTHQGFSEIGKPNHYNEDRFICGTQTFAIIDGATSLVNADMNGLNPSAYTSKFLAEFLMEYDRSPLSAKELLLLANETFAKHLEEKWPEILKLGKLGPSAAVAVFKIHEDNKTSVANVSDCTIVVERNEGWDILSQHNPRHSELDSQLADAIFTQIDKGMTSIEATKTPEIDAIRNNNRLLVNKEYGVFNHEPEMKNFLHSSEFSLTDCKTIILFSDGLEWPNNVNDNENSLITTAKMMKSQGVLSYYNQLKSEFDNDPNFQKYRRLKHMDDSTGMILTFKN